MRKLLGSFWGVRVRIYEDYLQEGQNTLIKLNLTKFLRKHLNPNPNTRDQRAKVWDLLSRQKWYFRIRINHEDN